MITHRLENIERKVYDHDKILEFLVQQSLPPEKGIFYDGKIFDAWTFVSGIIKSAKKNIILIDNYIDESVLLLLAKRSENVTATIFTNDSSKKFKLDLAKYKAQYPVINVKTFTKSHDRFLIIDNADIYHIGASLKDLGKKWFAFSRIDLDVDMLIKKLPVS